MVLYKIRFISLILILILSSCSMDRRRYNPGFYVERNAKQAYKTPLRSVYSKTLRNENAINPVAGNEVNVDSTNCLAANSESNVIAKENPENRSLPADSIAPCDLIVLRNAEEISARVIEITGDEVKYYKCPENPGPLYVLEKEKVFFIKYINGTKEVFEADSKKNSGSKSTLSREEKRIEGYAIMSLVFGIAGLAFAPYISGPFAILFGIKGLKGDKLTRAISISGIFFGVINVLMSLYMI